MDLPEPSDRPGFAPSYLRSAQTVMQRSVTFIIFIGGGVMSPAVRFLSRRSGPFSCFWAGGVFPWQPGGDVSISSVCVCVCAWYTHTLLELISRPASRRRLTNGLPARRGAGGKRGQGLRGFLRPWLAVRSGLVEEEEGEVRSEALAELRKRREQLSGWPQRLSGVRLCFAPNGLEPEPEPEPGPGLVGRWEIFILLNLEAWPRRKRRRWRGGRLASQNLSSCSEFCPAVVVLRWLQLWTCGSDQLLLTCAKVISHELEEKKRKKLQESWRNVEKKIWMFGSKQKKGVTQDFCTVPDCFSDSASCFFSFCFLFL